ncbi:WXG100 family type VII secretion target [Mycolicibacterium fortuitum]|uniref:WXG100 family type VII secretion target n=1 Tax=Mycolicibacterium fortuitum TaxID=1766 RepID=UPI003AAF07A4
MPQTSSPQPSSSQPLRVDPDDLVASANRIDGIANDLRAGHDAAHARMEAAQAGQVGRSADAVRGLVAKLRADTKATVVDLNEHGQAFRSAAQAYRDTDQRLAEKLKASGDRIPSGDSDR